MTLALEYRPRRFTELAGQVPVAAVLHAMARRRTVPPGLLLCGKHGSGKTSAARILGAALNCEAEPGPASVWPCGTCPECKAVANGTSLNVIELDAASNGGVAQIREIRDQALYATGGEYRLFILDEAHAMSDAAFNALLIVLENPPPGVVFVLLTTEPGSILPTVASRCHVFPFDPIAPAVIRDRLAYICADKGVAAEDELLAAIAERARGAMRDAVMLLEQAANVGICTLKGWQKFIGEPDFAPALLGAAAAGDIPGMFTELDKAMGQTGDYAWIIRQLISCMRDVTVLNAGGLIEQQGAALAARQAVASRLTPYRAVAGMRVLWDLQTRVLVADRAQGLQAACMMLSDALKPVQEELPTLGGCGPETSIEALRALVGQS